MFDVGFWELALIGIVTLLVVGPDRLPEVASTVGRWVLKTRRFVAGVKADFNRELQTGDLHKILGDQKQQINELRSMVDSTRRDFESTTKDAVSAAKSQFDSVEELGRTATPAAVANSTFPKTDSTPDASSPESSNPGSSTSESVVSDSASEATKPDSAEAAPSADTSTDNPPKA